MTVGSDDNPGKKTARAGAAAFAMSLFLVGPATGVASAEAGDSSPEVAAKSDSAGPVSSRGGKAGAVRPDRGPAGPRASRSSAHPVAARPAAAVQDAARGSTAERAMSARQSGDGGTSSGRKRAVRNPKTPAVAAVAPTGESNTGLRATAIPDNTPVAPADPAAAGFAAARSDESLVAAAGAAAPFRTGSVAAPAPAPAAARAPGVLNTAVVSLFDAVSGLLANGPAGPLSDFLAGAVLLVRRSLFDQAPTANPGQQQQTTAGEFEGTVEAYDPEGDPLTFEVVSNPQLGSVVVSDDGRYVYTAGADFTGSDSFIVKVTDGNGGFNVLDPRGARSAYAIVHVPDQGTPFDLGNRSDASLFLSDVTADLRIEQRKKTSVGSVSLDLPDDTPLMWRDESGRTGAISAADVAAKWGEIIDAGKVRLGLQFDSGDDVSRTVILDSVQAAYVSGRYVFSGNLASDVADGAGIDSYYDVIGGSYKSEFQAFLGELGEGGEFQATVRGANLYLDTFSLQDYREEFAGEDAGVPLDEIYAASTKTSVGAATSLGAAGSVGAAGALDSIFGSLVTYDQLLDETEGGDKALARLKAAVSYAQTGAAAFGATDPLFLLGNLLPKCVKSRTCSGNFYPINAGKGVVSLAKKSFGPVDLSFDFGPDSYGYVYAPASVWDSWDPRNYSLGVFMSLVAGPSGTVKLAGVPDPLGSGTLLYASSERQTEYSVPTQAGTFGLEAKLDTELKVQLGLPAGFNKDKLTAEFYGKAGLMFAYNTSGFPVQNDNPQLVIAKGWVFDANYKDFESIDSVSLAAKAVPSVRGTYALGLKGLPIIGDLSIASLSLGYINPLTATLRLAKNTDPSFTVGSSGTVDFYAGLIPGIAKSFGWENELSYKYEDEIYNFQSGNLLA